MRRSAIGRITSLGASLALGVVSATTVVPFSAIAILVWLVWQADRLRGSSGVGQTLGHTVLHTAVFGGVLYAAVLAPYKTIDRVRETKISLPSTRYTLAEFDALVTNPETRPSTPRRISLSFLESDKDLVVQFPSESLTMGELLDVFQEQTPLELHAASCGNSWTLLGGSNAGFGFYLSDPAEVGRRYDPSPPATANEDQ